MAQLMDLLSESSLPQQDQRSLSFTNHKPKAFEEWVNTLPIVNVGETAKMLYNGVQELNHLKASTALRLQLLELIRPQIHYTVDALKQHYAHHTILLSAKSRKVANLCQALQRHLAMGFKIVLLEALNGGFLNNPREHIPTAIHRSMSELSFVLLRCYQLYHPPLPRLWQEFHVLYALAEERDLLAFTIPDTEIDAHCEHRIADLYKKMILIATSHPNQLQPDDLENLFFCSNRWSQRVNISAQATPDGLYATNFSTDCPPGYTTCLAPDADPQHIRYIDLSDVVKHLQSLPTSEKKTRLLKAEHSAQDRAFLSDYLTQHLMNVWSQTSKRLGDRAPKTGMAEICLGLNACHQQILSEAKNASSPLPANQSEQDPHQAEVINLETVLAHRGIQQRSNKKPDRYRCNIINTSAHGACLLWSQQLPLQLKNGELLLLRLIDNNDWILGAIRWTRHFQGEGVRTGVQLFGPNIAPVYLQHIY
ncbi:MAG: hypothetical protein P8104_00770, partial [Gammaproteobacteria bacterium]